MKIKLGLILLLLIPRTIFPFQNGSIIDESLLELIANEVSGTRAKEHVVQISSNHRVQATKGFMDAANYVKGELKAIGIRNIKLHKYRSDGKTRYNAYTSPLSWEIKSGTLKMIKPAKIDLADYLKIPTSLTTLSNGGKWTGELVDVGKGTESDDFENVDVKDKMVLAYGYAGKVHREAVLKRGARGVVIRPADDDRPFLRDAVRYNGLWPTWDERKKTGFGFQISRVTSEKILDILQSGDKVLVQADVNAKLISGKLAVVSALIPGSVKNSGQFVLIAHLDHYKPGANDNASGSAALIEIARAIHDLIESGRVEQPIRSIRFLWVPEHFGTMAYLSKDIKELKGAFAGINLDMVGEDTDLTNSKLDVITTSASAPTYLNDLIKEILKAVDNKNIVDPGGTNNIFSYVIKPYMQGSDHDMMNDPSIGIPTVAIGYWADPFHHTNEDSPDKVDPTSLKRCMTIGAYTALWLTSIGKKEADNLALLTFARSRERIIDLGLSGSYLSAQNIDEYYQQHLLDKIDLQTDIDKEALKSIQLLNSGWSAVGEMYSVALEELGKSEKNLMLSRLGLSLPPTIPGKSGSSARIPKRNFIGPVSDSYADIWFSTQLGADYEWYSDNSLTDFDLIRYEIVNFMDGARTIAQIHKIVSALYGPYDIDNTERIIEDLEKLKLVEWTKI